MRGALDLFSCAFQPGSRLIGCPRSGPGGDPRPKNVPPARFSGPLCGPLRPFEPSLAKGKRPLKRSFSFWRARLDSNQRSRLSARSVMDVYHRHTSPYRVGGVVESRMARVSEVIVLVIDKFRKSKKGFQKVIKNFSEEDFGQSGKKVV